MLTILQGEPSVETAATVKDGIIRLEDASTMAIAGVDVIE